MANSIELAQKFVPIIDDIYKGASATQSIDAASMADFTGADEVKVLKVSTTGLGDYSRTNGYPKGEVTAAWETMKLTEERGKEFSVDRMDDEETVGLTFGSLAGDFMRLHVVPELDAYRFAKYASATGVSAASPVTLTSDDVLDAIDEASRQMDADEVPPEGRVLFVNSELKPVLNRALNRMWSSDAKVANVIDGYNDMQVIYVPHSRFYTGITLNDGQSSWGYAKATDATSINFMMVYPQSVLQVVKFALPKIFSPDENQEKDAWKFQFRAYHDAFVYENKAKGVYVHSQAKAAAGG